MKKIIIVCVLFIASAQISKGQNGMIGEVKLFAGNFAPRGWALCQGQMLAISSNSALFSILGTTYGGDGRSTFALPDLRGASAIGAGTPLGGNPVRLGQKSSSPAVYGSNGVFDGKINNTAVIKFNSGDKKPSTIKMDLPFKLNSRTSGSRTLGMNYIICTQGIYPSRS